MEISKVVTKTITNSDTLVNLDKSFFVSVYHRIELCLLNIQISVLAGYLREMKII